MIIATILGVLFGLIMYVGVGALIGVVTHKYLKDARLCESSYGNYRASASWWVGTLWPIAGPLVFFISVARKVVYDK